MHTQAKNRPVWIVLVPYLIALLSTIVYINIVKPAYKAECHRFQEPDIP